MAAHQGADADARAAEFLRSQKSREPRAVENRPRSEGGDLLRGLIPTSGALASSLGLGVRSVRVQEARVQREFRRSSW